MITEALSQVYGLCFSSFALFLFLFLFILSFSQGLTESNELGSLSLLLSFFHHTFLNAFKAL